MRKGFVAGAVLAMMLGISVPRAQAGGKIDDNTIDFSKLTCEELVAEIADDIKKGKSAEEASMMNVLMAAMWIDGYLSHETGDTKTSVQWVQEVVIAIDNGCQSSPKKPVLQIVKAAMKH
ncbi:putative Acid stress chaperone HdeA [uncultured Gammaproteobacteria bacterium]